jgi:CubicO group peptidase (beta-lactamase class C family)
MTLGIAPFAVVATTILAAAATAQDLPILRIDSVFTDMNRSDRPGCTLAVFKHGEIAYANGYGMANLEYGIALQPRSVFHIASISKQFTSFAVELLVSEGKVSWDDDIRTYVQEIPDYGTPITLRHLTHHTSGIRDQWNLLIMAGWRWEADLVTQDNAIEIMSRQTAVNFEPGTEYLYSNSGFTLLAAVVERVTGRTLNEYAHERIFSPLGMTSTHFRDDHQTVVRDRAYGYRYFNDEGWKISIPDFAIVGASSLFTTVEDMAKWDRNLRDYTLGDEALFERFLDRGVLANGDTISYAHGISVGSYRGLETIGHGGADAGYRTNYLRFPQQDVGIVSFCNFARSNPGRYVRQVADIVLADELGEAPDENLEPPSIDVRRWANTLERMTGFYRDPRQDRPIHVWLHDGRARARQGFGAGEAGLLVVPLGDDRYQLWPGDDTVTVTMTDGRPAYLESDGLRFHYVGAAVEHVDPTPYLGSYWSDELGTEYRIEADTGRAVLAMVHRRQATDRFRAAFEDGFWSGGDWLAFERDAGGRVVGFSWSNGRVRKVKFVRR